MSDPKMPPSIFSEGMTAASFDAVTVLALAIGTKFPDLKDVICKGLRARFDQHQKIVDEHGTAMNVNAASALRLIMIQIGCPEIPDHE